MTLKKKKPIRLRTKPEEPQRKTNIRVKYDLDYGDTLEQIMLWAKEWDVPFESVRAEYAHPECYGEDSWVFEFHRAETDEEFAIRRQDYEQKLADHHAWEAENKEAIAVERARREAGERKKREKDLKRIEREIAQHEKKAERLRKQL